MMCPAVCALTMAGPLADAARWVVTVNSAGSGRWRLPRPRTPGATSQSSMESNHELVK